jgi:hypothetical protein
MLYHTDVFIPDHLELRLPKGEFDLEYTDHAIRASVSDRYGRIVLPDSVNTYDAKVIEIEVIDESITKIVYRVDLDKWRDLVIVVIPYSWTVKTVWVNAKRDKHNTLNKERYAIA